jgi:hypothetical protein
LESQYYTVFCLAFSAVSWEIFIKQAKNFLDMDCFLGIALGVGIQLHAILLVLFPAVALAVFLYLLKNKQIAWKK